MDENSYNNLADTYLSFLSEQLSKHEESLEMEVDYQDGVLYITFDNGKQYVINRHRPSKQIWLSSPFSGADYFSYNDTIKQWVNKQNTSLNIILDQELHIKLC